MSSRSVLRLSHFGLAQRACWLGLAFCGFAVKANQIDIVGPPGSSAFGTSVTALPNGNWVVVDPGWPNGQNWGAAHLMSPAGALISTFLGDANHHLGNARVFPLKNGKFVLLSIGQYWNSCGGNGGFGGAATLIDNELGLAQTISCSNSLAGFDASGAFEVISLPQNGNYVIYTPYDTVWFGGSGALPVGAVSAGKSFHTSFAGKVFPLSNGNYVITDYAHDFPGAAAAGAVTWVDGNAGIVGAASSANSLVGGQPNDRVGYGGVVELSNGNYVVASPKWNNAGATSAGAVTWGSGTSGVTGFVSAGNSLVGVTQNDQVGGGSTYDVITPLPGGNYVVASSYWSDWSTGSLGVGAVTWCDGNVAGGRTGIVSANNSLIGVPYTYEAGYGGVKVLSNGNYVVESRYGVSTTYYAATWGSGTAGGPTGPITAANSLIGTSAYASITPLVSNGNYVFADSNWVNPNWFNPATGTTQARTVGAAMLVSGAAPAVGGIVAADALIGNGYGSPGYTGGAMRGITALSDGNYVVCTTDWQADGGANTPKNLGAVTWGDGINGTKGVVSALNSMTGSNSGDDICYMDSYPYQSIVALAGGRYLIRSPRWQNNGKANAGAVTWMQGGGIEAGVVSAANSLVGTAAGEGVGSNATSLTLLSNGNVVLGNPKWNDSATLPGAGSLTWANPSAPVVGAVSAANSLVGGQINDAVSGGGVVALANGRFVAKTPFWHSDAVTVVGAITFGGGSAALSGMVDLANSVVGEVPNAGATMSYAYDATRDALAVGRPASNTVTILFGDSIFSDGFEGP